jgi:hypothetical protein
VLLHVVGLCFWGASTKRCKDAGRVDSGAIDAAEDAAARRVIARQNCGIHRVVEH